MTCTGCNNGASATEPNDRTQKSLCAETETRAFAAGKGESGMCLRTARGQGTGGTRAEAAAAAGGGPSVSVCSECSIKTRKINEVHLYTNYTHHLSPSPYRDGHPTHRRECWGWDGQPPPSPAVDTRLVLGSRWRARETTSESSSPALQPGKPRTAPQAAKPRPAHMPASHPQPLLRDDSEGSAY